MLALIIQWFKGNIGKKALALLPKGSVNLSFEVPESSCGLCKQSLKVGELKGLKRCSGKPGSTGLKSYH